MMSWPLELSFTLDQAMVVGNDLIDLALIDTETLSQEQPWSERAWQLRDRRGGRAGEPADAPP